MIANEDKLRMALCRLVDVAAAWYRGSPNLAIEANILADALCELFARRTLAEPDDHPNSCGLRRASAGSAGSLGRFYTIEKPCDCGVHERKRLAAESLEKLTKEGA